MKTSNNGRTVPETHELTGNEVCDLQPSTRIPFASPTIRIEETWHLEGNGSIRIEEEAWIEDENLTLYDFLAVMHAVEIQPRSRITLMGCFPRELLLQAFSLEEDDDLKADIAAELARRGGGR